MQLAKSVSTVVLTLPRLPADKVSGEGYVACPPIADPGLRRRADTMLDQACKHLQAPASTIELRPELAAQRSTASLLSTPSRIRRPFSSTRLHTSALLATVPHAASRIIVLRYLSTTAKLDAALDLRDH